MDGAPLVLTEPPNRPVGPVRDPSNRSDIEDDPGNEVDDKRNGRHKGGPTSPVEFFPFYFHDSLLLSCYDNSFLAESNGCAKKKSQGQPLKITMVFEKIQHIVVFFLVLATK